MRGEETSRMARARIDSIELDAPWGEAGRLRLWTARATIGDRTRAFATDAPLAPFPIAELDARANGAGAAVIDLQAPIALAPVAVAKPWGREVWHSGFERRGVSGVTDGRHTTPLPWALALLGSRPRERLPLVKALEPRHEPLVGELYFEVHEEKHEVYVVTDVDLRAWPDGAGSVRFGMNPELRARFRDDARFRADYAAAVRRYRAAREAIGSIAAGAIGEALLAEERESRRLMTAFVNRRALAPGDVVHVPPGLPHGLEHGVRVIEVQTPVFERKILSFAQRVVTQRGWDTHTAVESMRIDAPPLAQVDVLLDDGAVRIERLARCDELDVLRVRLAPGASWRLPSAVRHRVCFALDAGVALGALALGREQSCVVPAQADRLLATNGGADASATFLLASCADAPTSAVRENDR